MRVIAGKYKGIRLASVKGADIRYTADAVKESLFSILRDGILNSRFLDLYAGSGSMGIEALSRGAESVAFVEIKPVCAKTISLNLARCNLVQKPPEIVLLNMAISRALEYFHRHDMQFDIIFLDPPYRVNLLKESLQLISDYDILSPDGDLIGEHDIKEKASEKIGNFLMTRQKIYGNTILSFYRFTQ